MGIRPSRVANAMRKEIGLILQRELRDPRLGFITITKVEVSPDLREAKAYYSVLGSDKQVKSSAIALGRAKGYIKKLVGDRIKLRYVPSISFYKDKGIEYGARVEEILTEIERKRKETEGNDE